MNLRRLTSKNATSLATRFCLSPLLLLLTLQLVALAGFMFGYTISAYTLPLAAALLCAVCAVADRRLLVTTAVTIALLALWCVVCGLVFDSSYDAMYYHKEAVIALAEGWNPLTESVLQSDPFAGYQQLALWLDNYPKGLWLFSSSIYALTGALETAKAVNILFLISVFAASFDVCKRVYGLSDGKAAAFAALFAANPVFLCQALTFYNDLAVGSLLIVILLGCIKIVERKSDAHSYAVLFCAIVLCTTIKFTAPVLAAAILLAFGLYYAFSVRWEIKRLLTPAAVVLLAFTIGAGLFGFDPYIEHLAGGKHLFYPVMGEAEVDIMYNNAPLSFAGKSGPRQMAESLFARTDNTLNAEPQLKIPLRVYPEEFDSMWNADVRMGGFGVLFSGLLCLSVLLGLILAAQRTKMRAATAVALGILTLLALFFPETWWARYASYIYYIPLLLLLYAFDTRGSAQPAGQPKQRVPYGWIGAICCLIAAANAVIIGFSVVSAAIDTRRDIDARLAAVRDQAQGRTVVLRVNDFPSHIKLFEEAGIDYVVSHTSLSDPQIFYQTTKYQFQ